MTDASASSCFCPPDRSSTLLWNQSCMPKNDAISATRRRTVSVSQPRLSSPNASSCHTLSVTFCSSGAWSTKPISDVCSRSDSWESRFPSNQISPSDAPWGRRAGFSWRKSVVLPQPDAPHSTQNSPLRMVRLTSDSAGCLRWG